MGVEGETRGLIYWNTPSGIFIASEKGSRDLGVFNLV